MSDSPEHLPKQLQHLKNLIDRAEDQIHVEILRDIIKIAADDAPPRDVIKIARAILQIGADSANINRN